MTSSATSAIDHETVVEVIVDVWSSFLDDETIAECVAPDEDGDRVVASVCVDGPWSGAILLSMTRLAGRRVAAGLLAIDGDAVTDADVADAVGEMANVVGGNLKTLLPPPSSLSLPIVANGSQPRVVAVGATEVIRVPLEWCGESVEVGVWENRS